MLAAKWFLDQIYQLNENCSKFFERKNPKINVSANLKVQQLPEVSTNKRMSESLNIIEICQANENKKKKNPCETVAMKAKNGIPSITRKKEKHFLHFYFVKIQKHNKKKMISKCNLLQ